jgi:uncharacterized protein (TIGR02246 family)
MPARRPEEVDILFAEALSSGNLDALAMLYEPQASLSPQPGKVVTGVQAIREALSGLLASKPKITLKPQTLAVSGETGLVTAQWELSGTAPDGKPIQMAGRSAEVLRRQADGTWLFVIDWPWGLE